MKPMRILFINTLYHPHQIGGAEVSVELLARELVRLGHAAAVICVGPERETQLSDVGGVMVYRFPIRNIYWPFERTQNFVRRFIWHLVDIYNPLAKRDVEEIINSYKPDVVHTNNLSGISVAAWKAANRSNIKILHTSRDYYLLHPNCKLRKNNRNQKITDPGVKLWSSTKRKASLKVDSYVGISDYILELHLRAGFFSNARKKTIYNSVARTETNENQNHHKVIDARLIFGFIGRIEPSKGLDVLLTAFGKYTGDACLLIAGTGNEEYLSHLRRICSGKEITFLGHTNADEFYKSIDILVVPSEWNEPLGRVVLEAYAYGVPSITSDTGGLPEIIDKGVTGYTYSAGDADDLCQKMHDIARQDLLRMSCDCKKESAKYDEAVIANYYISEYKTLCSKNSRERANLG